MSEEKGKFQEQIESIQSAVLVALGDHAEKTFKENGTKQHFYITAAALLDLAHTFALMPIKSAKEVDEKAHETITSLLDKANAVQGATIAANRLAGVMRDIPTLSVLLGLMQASMELLADFDNVVTDEIEEDRATPTEEASQPADVLSTFQAVLQEQTNE